MIFIGVRVFVMAAIAAVIFSIAIIPFVLMPEKVKEVLGTIFQVVGSIVFFTVIYWLLH
jgi:hypothetical protein